MVDKKTRTGGGGTTVAVPAASLAAEIKPEQSVELLQELHILTRDGKLNQDSRRKLKQVYHLYHFIEPLLQEVLAEHDDLTLADHGAGKSYLGFILYDLFLKARTAAASTVSKRARNWWKSRRRWRRGWVSSAWISLT
jgi:hypothetical protein